MALCSLVSLDDFLDLPAREVVDNNYDDPRLTDFDLLVSVLAELRANGTADAPIYSHAKVRCVGGLRFWEVWFSF